MKRIAKALVIAALASATAVATAADSPFPTPSLGDNYSQADVFPGVRLPSYKGEHRESIANQPLTSYPYSDDGESVASSDFPDIPTYRDIHRNDPVPMSTTSTFPFSDSETGDLDR